MSADRHPVRSYARLFRPTRRLYAVEGHRLPVPGGVPLRWLGWAAAAVLAVLALSSRAPLLSALLAGGAALLATGCGAERATALAAAAATAAAAQVIGYLLVTLGWPIRLVVLPAAVATIATQATPDGRAAHRYAWSWLIAQVRPERRTLGRPIAGEVLDDLARLLPVAPDHHGARLRRARITGPARVRLTVGVELRHGRQGSTRVRARASADPATVELGAGERLEVRR